MSKGKGCGTYHIILKEVQRILKPWLVCGYPWVWLCKEGKHYRKAVHILVLNNFIGPCPPGMEACHEDGIRTNTSLINLRWDTRKNNHADKHKHGTAQIGEDAPNVKLNEKKVKEIRYLFSHGKSIEHLSYMFDVTKTNIRYIVQRKIWAHVH